MGGLSIPEIPDNSKNMNELNKMNFEDIYLFLIEKEKNKSGMKMYGPQIAYLLLENGWKMNKIFSEQNEKVKDFILSL